MTFTASNDWDIAIINSLILTSSAKGHQTSNLRLQKLAYFTHGIYSASSEEGAPMIEEPFKAWPYEPVLESLYHAFKAHGAQPISFLLTDNESQSYQVPEGHKLNTFISCIIDWGKGKRDMELMRLSHAKSAPWYCAYYNESSDDDVTMDQAHIASYFKKFMREQQLDI